MIPKIIHCIWLGKKELPPLEKKCIETWSKINPDFEIIFWNEDNLDITDPVYLSAYNKKEWAYCSDYARMKVVYEYGGVYLDTDMELIKPLNDLLHYSCFIGKEDKDYINAAIVGAVKECSYIKDVFEEIANSMKSDFVPIPRILTSIYNKGEYKEVKVFPVDYFYPYNPFKSEVKELFFSDVTENTYAIHHWKYSWKASIPKRIVRKIRRIMTRNKYFSTSGLIK